MATHINLYHERSLAVINDRYDGCIATEYTQESRQVICYLKNGARRVYAIVETLDSGVDGVQAIRATRIN